MLTAPPPLASSQATTPPSRRAVNLVVIHCSATVSGKQLGTLPPGRPGVGNAAWTINAWHAKRGFARRGAAVRSFNSHLPSIGYHYVVDLDGTVLNGRSLEEVPAQAAGFNASAVGICLVGGSERVARYTPKQWSSLAQITAFLLGEYGLPAAAPRRIKDATAPQGYRVEGGVCGHRDLSPDANGNGLVESFEWLKTCPGFDVGAWLANKLQPLPEHIYPS